MNVMIRTIILAAVMAAACGLAPCAAQTQDPKANKRSEEAAIASEIAKGKEVRVIRLASADAASTAKTIGEVFKQTVMHRIGTNHSVEDLRPVRVTADERTNSLLVMSSEADFAAVRKLVADLDKEKPADQDQRFRMRIVQLKHQPDDALATTLKLLTSPDGEQYSIDQLRRQIVLLARDTTAKTIDEFVARWDVAPPAAVAPPVGDVQIRVVWISSDAEVATSRPLPDDLKPLIPAFKKIGLDKPFAAATYVVTTTPNTEFSTVGATHGISSNMRISGLYGDRKSLPILSIAIREVDKEDRQIDIVSDLTAPLGHLIVLGATTVGAGQQQMAFVVQVTRPDSINPAAKP